MRKGASVAALLCLVAAAVHAEEMPKIFLEKRIFAETSEGKRNFYEVHTVSEGESLWKIMRGISPFFPSNYSAVMREFRRANPEVRNPGRLMPGQKILIPSGLTAKARRMAESGKVVSHRVVRGDELLKILAARGIPREDRDRYLSAVMEVNESVRDMDRIYAGQTLLIPTAEYFEEAPSVAAAPLPGSLAAAAPPSEPVKREEKEPPASAVALTRDVPPQPGQEAVPAAKPEAQLVAPSPAPPGAGSMIASPAAKPAEEVPLASARPVYRGLLSDLAAGLGEKWIDRGTLYLPIPAGGEVVLDLGDYPVVRLSTGFDLLVDFHDGIPANVRALITETWKNYRVVSMGGSSGPMEMLDRFLEAAGYHSAKEGNRNPLVIGEKIAIAVPADRIVLKTPQSLLNGEVFLLKEVSEKPGGDLSAVLRYAGRVGIRVLPFAVDRSASEGFLVRIDAMETTPEDSPEAVPKGGLPAVDYALSFLGVASASEEKIRIGEKGGSFQLTIQPERIFDAGGKRYVVDAGKMSPPLRSIVRDSGYEIFTVGKEEGGQSIFRRILSVSGIPYEERERFLLFGGEDEGFEVRVTGTFLTSAEYLGGRKIRAAILLPGKVHSATRELMRRFGVEIVEW